MTIDFNAHFGASPEMMTSCSAEALARMEKAAGIDVAVASDLAGAFGGAASEDDLPPRRFVIFTSLSPSFDPHALPPAGGVRIYPTYHVWDLGSESAASLLSTARERNLIVQIYLRLRDPRALPVKVAIAEVIQQVYKLAQTNADVRFVISGVSYAEVKGNQGLFGRPNVWTDISHVQHPINSLPKLLELIDSSHLLFGSGAPVLYPYANVFRVINSPISDEAKDRILCRNARELLGDVQ